MLQGKSWNITGVGWENENPWVSCQKNRTCVLRRSRIFLKDLQEAWPGPNLRTMALAVPLLVGSPGCGEVDDLMEAGAEITGNMAGKLQKQHHW